MTQFTPLHQLLSASLIILGIGSKSYNGFYPHWLSGMKFALLTTIWWARVVPTHLLPKEMDLQSIAVADLLLTHIELEN